MSLYSCNPTLAAEMPHKGPSPAITPLDGDRECWGRMCLWGSRAGSAILPGEAVPWELIKQHFISKQAPRDLLCEGHNGERRGEQNRET